MSPSPRRRSKILRVDATVPKGIFKASPATSRCLPASPCSGSRRRAPSLRPQAPLPPRIDYKHLVSSAFPFSRSPESLVPASRPPPCTVALSPACTQASQGRLFITSSDRASRFNYECDGPASTGGWNDAGEDTGVFALARGGRVVGERMTSGPYASLTFEPTVFVVSMPHHHL